MQAKPKSVATQELAKARKFVESAKSTISSARHMIGTINASEDWAWARTHQLVGVLKQSKSTLSDAMGTIKLARELMSGRDIAQAICARECSVALVFNVSHLQSMSCRSMVCLVASCRQPALELDE